MWQESSEQVQPLRTGFTTGTCATACSVAAARALFEPNAAMPTVASVTLPRGKTIELTVQTQRLSQQSAKASTIKDAGDDPDITHGAELWSMVELITDAGVHFAAGEGVGKVTKAGLLLAKGEPAINPVPRKMMTEHLQDLAQQYQYSGGFLVTVGVIKGEQLAQKTMNPKLGILGGLSILGTTGIVRPFSCAAWIASIHQGIDVAHANGLQHLGASTGNASEQLLQQRYQFNDTALIEMGDFVGAVLKHLKKLPVAKMSLSGGIGKISKLANGHMDLHSRVSSIDFTALAQTAKNLGADEPLQQKILAANTSVEVVELCHDCGINIAQALCEQALNVCVQKIKRPIEFEVLAINRRGELLAQAATKGFEASL
ncbi:cobalt-precorrin-5B (C(1))-methyltransferase [Reinekea thalattae]|uniref:Cobalt-precorrin-5B C(1)-methyltransferase n=1 Tax=Reinekea thalattae TaxID=2593301 RepID=A0A5C8Z9V4_9GAMM|nr:cobalt-precorrin-5B (C(1))-methyltransferase [Reinekea thalattae]TXR53656.1 cobalt-precorrin-5B (C(1))-methyltransferase [Reinekea thalattae]